MKNPIIAGKAEMEKNDDMCGRPYMTTRL